MIANWRVVSTAVAFVAALIGCGVGPSKAQTFPDRPVRFVVPFAADTFISWLSLSMIVVNVSLGAPTPYQTLAS
jgi:hypothetical protein